ncbi:MAG: response regulator [Candidatus Acidiferrales bacterium]
MTPTIPASAGATASAKKSSPNGVDRRRRRRAKITAQVHLLGGVGTAEQFQEICVSVDVSRDGLLYTTKRAGYWIGQPLDVTFPYSSAATAINTSQKAKVVRVDPTPDNKFSVAVEFQAAAAQDAQSGAGSSAGARQATVTNQVMVLTVESDPRMAETMRVLLQQDGYQVVTVKTAQQALEVLKTATPAVVLAEVEGDEMSGHDLCLIIKKNDRLRNIPVILLTRSAQPADYSASHQFGAVVCMAKPFKPERLLHVVRLVAPPPVQRSAYGARLGAGSVERTL